MKNFFWLFFYLGNIKTWGQEDLLSTLSSMDSSSQSVIATFKGQKLISAQTTEQAQKKHLVFNILHRFGDINSGVNNFFGLDESNIRFVLEYGLSNRVQLSVGRSNIDKMYDVGVKVKIFSQRTGFKPFPFSISYYGNMGINTTETKIFDYAGGWGSKGFSNLVARMNYTHQVIVTRKENKYFSWLLAPTVVWYNLVDLSEQKNFIFLLGLGGSARISRSTRLNVEYYPRLVGSKGLDFRGNETYNHLGVGFDIETGGHVFQFMFTNSNAMLEQQFLSQTYSSWKNFNIKLGFNISRTYSFDKVKHK